MEELKQIQIQKQSGIQGFHYDFARSLVDKLKELLVNDRIFVDGNEKCQENNQNFHTQTKIAELVLHFIEDQFPCQHGAFLNVPRINEVIALAEEFLAIFEKNKKCIVFQSSSPSLISTFDIKSMSIIEILLSPIDILEMDTRLENTLRARKMKHVYETFIWTEGYLMTMHQFGKKTQMFLEQSLYEVGIDQKVKDVIYDGIKDIHSTTVGQLNADLQRQVLNSVSVVDHRLPKMTLLQIMLRGGIQYSNTRNIIYNAFEVLIMERIKGMKFEDK